MKISVKNMTVTAVFVAITCILSMLPLGFNILGVAVTLQTYVVAFSAYVLGWKSGAANAALYVLLGLILPVYSNMTSGFGILFGPTGGFLFGFIILAVACGITLRIENRLLKAIISLTGLCICHVMGLMQYVFVMDMDITGGFTVITLPYLPKDILMVGLAYMTAGPVRKNLNALR